MNIQERIALAEIKFLEAEKIALKNAEIYINLVNSRDVELHQRVLKEILDISQARRCVIISIANATEMEKKLQDLQKHKQ